jgi:hypothetical protein
MTLRRGYMQPYRAWRRWSAHLALLLTVFAVLQPSLANAQAPGGMRFRDQAGLSAAPAGVLPHDHNHVLCHHCPGHTCLEQHGAFDLPPGPLAILPASVIVVLPSESFIAWPHPPTGPPHLPRPPRSWQARAPPSL